jgi:hypothetical protein
MPSILEDRNRVLEGGTHGLEALNLKLQCVPLYDIWIASETAHNTSHEAFLGRI